MIILGKICQDNFCTRCRSRSHATHMCRVPSSTCNSNICIYCSSTHHASGNYTSWPNNNWEEPRSTPLDLYSQGPYYGANTENSGVPRRNAWNSTNPRPASTKNHGNYISDRQQVYTNNTNVSFPYRDYRYNQNRTGCQQTRFDERYNKQYSPNYYHYTHHPSPPVSVAGPHLSATLIDLANIQSRSLDLIVANQKSQQDVYNKLTMANRDKANNAMFTAINTYDGVNREIFKEWIDKLDQACRINRYDFRTEIIKKSIGAICKVVLTSCDCSDDQLLANLRSCFPDAPTMNQAREDLRNMRLQEKESIMIYTYRWGRALVRSSAIHPQDERHPHVNKDFISSLQHNIRNKITNKWADLKNPPGTVQEASDLAIKTETQIQVADSFKLALSSNFSSPDVNEISMDDTSCDEFDVNEVSKGKNWKNNYRKGGYRNESKLQQQQQIQQQNKQDNKAGNKWGCRERDSQDHSPTWIISFLSDKIQWIIF